MTDSTGMVTVHMSHDDPTYIERIEAQRTQSRANLLFQLYPPPFATLHEGMPPWLIAGIVCVRALPSVDDYQAFRMLDQPAADWKARTPIGVHQDIEHSRRASFISGMLMATLDLYVACLNAVQFHGSAPRVARRQGGGNRIGGGYAAGTAAR
jgi:hypothetical protein